MEQKTYQGDLVILAFDTVTSKVGYTFRRDPTRKCIRMWTNESIVVEDVPTCLLMKPDGKTLDSFGYKAESRYSELVADGVHTKYFYFKGLKGLNHLEERTCEANVTIEDESGKELPAAHVFAMMFRSLVNTTDLAIRIEDVALLLIQPVDASPMFIKLTTDAMKKAGVHEKKIMVLKSSEAAAVLFKHLLTDPICSTGETRRLGVGTQFLTIILGEESVGMVIHKIEPSGQIREIGDLRKGSWGFVAVLDRFEKFLEDIIGNLAYKRFKCEYEVDWQDLMRDVKIKLVRLSRLQDLNTYTNIRIPLSFQMFTKEIRGRNLNELIADSDYKDNIQANSTGVMKLSCNFFTSLYEVTLRQMVANIQSTRQIIDFQAIIMIGKLGDVRIFKETIRSSFSDLEIVSPIEASVGVLEGGFIFAHSSAESILYNGEKPPLVVTAIDFGTTFSGWSRLYRHAYLKDPTTPCKKTWTFDMGSTPKAPTSVLLNEGGKKIVAFGYDAINRYNELLDEGNHESFYFSGTLK